MQAQKPSLTQAQQLLFYYEDSFNTLINTSISIFFLFSCTCIKVNQELLRLYLYLSQQWKSVLTLSLPGSDR